LLFYNTLFTRFQSFVKGENTVNVAVDD